MEELWKALSEYLIKSPLWLICIALMICEGILFLLIMFGFNSKKIKKFGKLKVVLPIGIAISSLVFLFQNFTLLIESKMTLELLESNMLSSILLSFAIMCVISIISLPIHEVIRFKGGNSNNGN